jgi:hypothetical protein
MAKSPDSNVKNAVLDMVKELAKVFKHYTRNTREAAWRHLVSANGKREMDKVLANPDRSPNTFQKLISFKEWRDQHE